VPDLGKIQPPDQAPADLPDQKTIAEAQELKRKAPTAVEREIEERHAHVESLHARIEYHHGECDQLRANAQTLRAELTNEQQQTKELSVTCAVLQTSGCAVGCMTTLGNFLTVLGSILLGISGGMAGLTEPQKAGLTGSGAALAISGGVFVLASYPVGWWAQWRSRPVRRRAA
jgi:hypothetical protein